MGEDDRRKVLFRGRRLTSPLSWAAVDQSSFGGFSFFSFFLLLSPSAPFKDFRFKWFYYKLKRGRREDESVNFFTFLQNDKSKKK